MNRKIFRLNDKKIFFRLFIIYAVVLFALILVSAFFIGRIHFNALTDETNKTYSEIIKNAKSDSIAGMSNADADALRILNDKEVIAFFTDFYDDPMEQRLNRFNVINELMSTCNNAHEINSIAAYNLNNQYILTNLGGYTQEEYRQNYGEQSSIFDWAAENNIRSFTGIAGDEHGMYIIRSYPLNSNNKYIRGYILLELNRTHINSLFAENLPQGTQYRVVNNDGTVVFGNMDSSIQLPDVSKISNQESGKRITLNHRKYILFCNYDAELVPWTFYMLVDARQGGNVMRTLVLAEILIGLLTFIFGLCITYYASKVTCNPVDEFLERTAKRIHDISSSDSTESSDRYSYESIELIMNKIIMDDQQMREEIRETMPSRKWNLMLKLLSGEVKTFSEISAAANMFGIHLCEGSYAIMMSEFENNEDSDDFAIYAPMMCKRIESTEGCMAVVTIGNRIIAFLSSMLDDEEFIEQIRELNVKISQTFKNLYNKKYNAGVSNIFHDLSKAKNAYEQSLKCLDFDFVTQGDGLILYRDINDYSDDVFMPFIKKSVKIGEAIKKRDKSDAEKYVNSIFEIMNGHHFPKQYLRYIIDLVRYEIIETIQDMGIIVPQEVQDMCSENIVSGNDMQKIKESITDEIVRTIGYVKSEVEDMSSKVTMKRVIDYVNENYRNSNISIAELGEVMNISSTYITNGFKKFEGMSFYEYLTQLRMNEAGRLLLKTNKKIYEVADDVGYTSSQSFIRAFKKYYGLTPDKFRNNSSAKKI